MSWCEGCGGEYGHSTGCPEAQKALVYFDYRSKIRELKEEVEKWQKRALLAEAKLDERNSNK